MNKSNNKNVLFTQLYDEHYNKVMRICLGYVNGNNEIAKDLTQEVFIKIWRHLDNFEAKSKISTWIFRIAINTCLLYLRDSKNIKTPKPSSGSVEDKIVLEARIRKMYECINKLDSKNKSIILLELESIPQKEIASIMGMTHEAIRVRILRIKKTLSKLVME